MRLLRVSTAALIIAVLPGAGRADGQTPTGAVAGIVTDSTGASLAGASVSIVHEQTGQTRTLNTGVDGVFTAPSLPPGSYRITVTAVGFKRASRTVTVEAGTAMTVDLMLDVGDVTETMIVSGAQSLVRRDEHQVGGVVTRDQIERLPLNGRNFLELAKVEPGVIPSRLTDGRMFVSSLGGGLQTIPRIGATRITVDGANVTTPATAGVLLQVSQDVVQEFQMATVNFDPSTSATSNGAINVVTRSGTNSYRGSGFYFYRDHHLAAYPGLRRDPTNPRPFFERDQFGLWAGGPLRKNRSFFFGSFERTDQVGVASIQPRDEFAPLGGIFESPYSGNQFNGRFDLQLHSGHAVFVRHTTDRNRTFANTGPSLLPSSWSVRVNRAHQTVGGLTSVLSQSLVSDFRVAYFSTSTPLTAPTADDCRDCFGLGEIRTTVSGANLIFGGQTSARPTGWRFQLNDNVSWQKANHTLRFGFEWDHSESTATTSGLDSGEITLFPPSQARQVVPQLPLPAAFVTPADILKLPLRDFSVTVGSATVLWQGFRPDRRVDLYRLHFGDTWRASHRLTFNFGLGWAYEPNALNHDLAKPALLTPILGPDGLKPPKAQTHNFSPVLGFVWAATNDGKTVVRGGAGRYFDPASSSNALNLSRERDLLSPLGTGTLTSTGANVSFDGHLLSFQQPTPFTGAQLLAILPLIREALRQSLNPGNRDLSVRNLDRTKEGTNLHDPYNTTPYAIHLSVGVQRELVHGVVVSADVAWKRFIHTFINGIDYNRFTSSAGPVISRCAQAQRDDVHAVCSNGPIFFDTTIGRARYLGLLMRAEKRFSGRTQLLASYALGSFVGSNGTGTGTTENPGGRVFGFNNDQWFENYGPLPTDQRHILNVSGVIELPLQFELAASVSAYSAPPFAAFVRDMDFNGDGTTNDLLPGTRINQFGRDLGRNDLANLVEAYNRQVAGTRTAGGQTAPGLTLPGAYAFNDGFFTQDLRITRSFNVGAARHQATVFVEVFNVFNTANLVGFGSDLTQPTSFGQASARFSQIFGSGGPRAFQVGARLTF